MICLRHSISLFVMISLYACSGQDAYRLQSDIDEQTGISLTRPAEPLQLAARRPGLSDVGKDYLFTAPVTVSGIGAPQTYLWFGVGSSVDRHIRGAPLPQWQSIIVVVDGTAMTFDLIPWSEAASSTPYKTSARLLRSYAAKVTSSQIRQIAGAQHLEAFVTDIDTRSPVYSFISGDQGEWLQLCCTNGLSALSGID